MSRVDADFSFRRKGRNWAALLSVLGIWAVLLIAIVAIDAALWLMGVVALFTLPAAWEVCNNPKAGFDMNDAGVLWFTGKRRASLNWLEIDRFRLDTRLDFSVRATAVLTSGKKIRLPYECTPPHKALEAALNARGIRTERHHFSLIG